MSAKIAAFITTLIVNAAMGVAVLFFLLVAMNGYSESDANYGLATYIALAVSVTLLMSIASVLLVRRLLKRGFRSAVAMLISIPIFSAAGAGLKMVCGMVGVLVAEYVRVNY